jgi:hypothetical protein
MMNSVETRVDGSTLIVRIPIRFHHHGGRKRIVAPDGSEIAPTSKPQPDGTLEGAGSRLEMAGSCWTTIAIPGSPNWRTRSASAAPTSVACCG